MSIDGNKTADQLTKFGAEYLLTGPEAACGISAGTDKTLSWTEQTETIKKCCKFQTGLKQAKGFLQEPSVKRNKELSKLNRNQLQWVTGLLTRNCHLKGHLFEMRLANSPNCKMCLEKRWISHTHTSYVTVWLELSPDFITWTITLCSQVLAKCPFKQDTGLNLKCMIVEGMN
jgi:hypothetical protein